MRDYRSAVHSARLNINWPSVAVVTICVNFWGICGPRLNHKVWGIEDILAFILMPCGKLFLRRQDLKVHVHVLDGSLVDVLIRLRCLLSHNQIGIVDFIIKLIVSLLQVWWFIGTSTGHGTRSWVRLSPLLLLEYRVLLRYGMNQTNLAVFRRFYRW